VVVVAALAFLVDAAVAQPYLTGITPGRTSADSGAAVTITGGGIGSLADLVQFPGGVNVSPFAAGPGYVVVIVPSTWSGSVRVFSAAMAMWSSNTLELEVTFRRAAWRLTEANHMWYICWPGLDTNQRLDMSFAVDASYGIWECASGLSIAMLGSHTYDPPANVNDGYNIYGATTSGWDPTTVSLTYVRYDTGSGALREFGVDLNAQHFTWSRNYGGMLGTMNVQNVVSHDIGHVMGLLDKWGTADGTDTMFGYAPTLEEHWRETLTADDIEGAESILPHDGWSDLQPWAPAGWFTPLVPSAVANATETFAYPTGTLPGNGTTYLSHAEVNGGLDCAAPSASIEVRVDDQTVRTDGWVMGYWNGGPYSPGVAKYFLNNACTIRGGRHALEVRHDATDHIVESNESNNSHGMQYVWSPYVLADQAVVTRAVPPEPGAYAAPNCDGFQLTGNWWGAVGLIPRTAGDDYDLSLYGDYTGFSAGFGTPLASSTQGGQWTDFVLFNGNLVGDGATRQVGVERYLAASGGEFLIQQANQVGSSMTPPPSYGAEISTGTINFGGSDILKVHEVYLGDTNTTYRFTLRALSGTPNLDVGLFAADDAYAGRADAVAQSAGAAGGGQESFLYRPTVAGWHGIVVFRESGVDVGTAGTYELRIGAALGNLYCFATPTGWSAPLVPRSSSDATPTSAPVTPTLTGNLTGTWLNFSVTTQGPGILGAWEATVVRDEEASLWSMSVADGYAPNVWSVNNQGPVFFTGGRHTLALAADPNGFLPETDESDNVWRGQWVWSPLVTARATPAVRTAPPRWGLGTYANCDGAQFPRTAGYAWVTAIAPTNAADDYDLNLYDDYLGANSGFSNVRARSTYGGNATDFVVGHYVGTPTVVYPGAVRYNTGPGGSYVLDQTDAIGHGAYATGNYPGQTLAANRIVDVFEANLTAGQSYRFLLTRRGGTADLALALYPANSGGIYARGQALVNGSPVTPDCDVVTFTVTAPDVSGWHPVVVYRSTGSDVGTPVTYDLTWGAPAVSAVGDDEPQPAAVFSFTTPFPNPTTGQTTFSLSLPAAGPVTLDLYDLRGRRVATLVDGTLSAGTHTVPWSGTDVSGRPVSSGVYYARLRAQGRELTQRVNVVR
jgi:hypothetical protein